MHRLFKNLEALNFCAVSPCLWRLMRTNTWVHLIKVHQATWRKSAVTVNPSYLLVSLHFCLREAICSQSDPAAIWACSFWMDCLLHFFFWHPVTSFHFIWGMYKMYVSWVLSLETGQAVHSKTISRFASPKSTWLSCSPTVTDSLGETLDDVTRHPGKLTRWAFKSSRHILNLNDIWRARGRQVHKLYTHWRLLSSLCCNIFTHKMFLFHHHFNRKHVLLRVSFQLTVVHFLNVCFKTDDNSQVLIVMGVFPVILVAPQGCCDFKRHSNEPWTKQTLAHIKMHRLSAHHLPLIVLFLTSLQRVSGFSS